MVDDGQDERNKNILSANRWPIRQPSLVSWRERTAACSPPLEIYDIFRVDLPGQTETVIPANKASLHCDVSLLSACSQRMVRFLSAPSIAYIRHTQGSKPCANSAQDNLFGSFFDTGLSKQLALFLAFKFQHQ